MRVRFVADFDHRPSGARHVVVAFKAGHELTVTREAGRAAIEAGKAKEIRTTAQRKPEDADRG